MATSRGALKPRRTVPPRTSTTWTSMSSPMRMVSPTLRVRVSTGTPPWVWLAVRGRPRGGGRGAVTTPRASLSAQGTPDRMRAVREHDLPAEPRERVDRHGGPQVHRGGADVPAGDGQQAVQQRVAGMGQPQLGADGPGQDRGVV